MNKNRILALGIAGVMLCGVCTGCTKKEVENSKDSGATTPIVTMNDKGEKDTNETSGNTSEKGTDSKAASKDTITKTKDVVTPEISDSYVELGGTVVGIKSDGVTGTLTFKITGSGEEKAVSIDRNTLAFDEKTAKVVLQDDLLPGANVRVFTKAENLDSVAYAEVIMSGDKMDFIKVGKIDEVVGDLSIINKFADKRLVLLNGCAVLNAVTGLEFDTKDISLSDIVFFTVDDKSKAVLQDDKELVKTEFDDEIKVVTTMKLFVHKSEK